MTQARLRILIAEDDEAFSSSLTEVLEGAGYAVEVAGSAEAAAPRVGQADVLVTDLRLPGKDGLELLREARRAAPQLPVLVMTAFGTIPTAVEAMRRGARAYLTKPFDPEELLLHLADISEALAERARASRTGRGDLVGGSARMRRAYEEIDLAARSDRPVLVTGETGTGKELAARAIHELSARRRGPYVAVNLGAVTATLAESELFGHERGSFTGAAARRRGVFTLASGGTLLCDEIDSLPLELQPKLLRALESGEIRPLGAEHPLPCDVRVVATTNADLEAAVADGRFRKDLYYRLCVLRVGMPPLRDRPEDIPVLVRAILDRQAQRTEVAGSHGPAGGVERRVVVTPEALTALMAHPWPGNVRELSNVVDRAFARAASSEGGAATIDYQHLDVAATALSELPFRDARARAADEWARRTILRALDVTDGNVSRAADMLRINRTALFRLIRRYGISVSS